MRPNWKDEHQHWLIIPDEIFSCLDGFDRVPPALWLIIIKSPLQQKTGRNYGKPLEATCGSGNQKEEETCTLHFSIFPLGFSLLLPLFPTASPSLFFNSPWTDSRRLGGIVVQSMMGSKLAGAERPWDERGNEKEVSSWELGGTRGEVKKKVIKQTQTNTAFDLKRAV